MSLSFHRPPPSPWAHPSMLRRILLKSLAKLGLCTRACSAWIVLSFGDFLSSASLYINHLDRMHGRSRPEARALTCVGSVLCNKILSRDVVTRTSESPVPSPPDPWVSEAAPRETCSHMPASRAKQLEAAPCSEDGPLLISSQSENSERVGTKRRDGPNGFL